MLKAKSSAITVRTFGNQGKTVANAEAVIVIPVPAVGSFQTPVTTITSAVVVQTMTVSMKGSSSATRPSLIGSCVRAAEWDTHRTTKVL